MLGLALILESGFAGKSCVCTPWEEVIHCIQFGCGCLFPTRLRVRLAIPIGESYIEELPLCSSAITYILNHICNMISLSGKVIAITGGASGIGRCTAILAASLGAKVSIADLSQEGLDAVAKEIKSTGHGDVFTMTIDVRKASTVDTWIAETVKWGGRLDGAANLAGVIGKSIGLKGASLLVLHWKSLSNRSACLGQRHRQR